MAVPGRGTAASPVRSAKNRRERVRPSQARSGRPALGPEDPEPSPLFLVAAYVVVFLLGVVLALLGTFLLAAGPRIGSTLVLPIGLVIALVGHPLAGWIGLRLTGTRAGTLAGLVGWSVVVLPMSSGTREGDVVLPSSLLSIAFLLVGIGSYGLFAFLTRPTRGMAAAGRR